MTNPLLCNIGNDKLLDLYGADQYSSVWTYRQAWAAAVRQQSTELFAKLRQEMLQLHLDLYPEDPRWRLNWEANRE